ncbi:MAG: prepilin-type N-terminal cleavage/methylation domain-containing protein [Sandaracinus sp.]|nr:prepilin-type N-terminal cleavage/methylation domain-containing protein [Sandaracinus sp.]MCB9633309.1 prepilin-type N-terminal cleavage/methylation domain-containing protein [Sandaracinus sp.]
MPHRRPRRVREEGLTLVEMMIVVALLALVAVGVSYGIGALHRTKLRSAAMDVVGAARFAYHRAVSRSATVRLAFDLDAHTIAVEEANGHVTLDVSEDAESDDEEDRSAADPWARAQARLDGSMSAQLGRSAFGPIEGSDGSPMKKYLPHRLPVVEGNELAAAEGDPRAAAAALDAPEVRIYRVITPHEPEPRETGRGYVYFFPGGRTEHAYIYLTDDDGTNVYTVEIHPLTGRAMVHRGELEPEEMSDEGEVRDPG